MIVRALGIKDSVAVDVVRIEPKAGETYLMCSDGLSGMISDEEMLELVNDAGGDLEKACQTLIASANAAGGEDNVTVVLVSFNEN